MTGGKSREVVSNPTLRSWCEWGTRVTGMGDFDDCVSQVGERFRFTAAVISWHLFGIPILGQVLEYFSIWTPSILRICTGKFACWGTPKSPEKPIRMYEYEGCPHCLRVRETCSELALTVHVYPCPHDSKGTKSIYRQNLDHTGEKIRQFPYMEDLNTGVKMYESEDIHRYLWKTYGKGCTPSPMMMFFNFFPTISKITQFGAALQRSLDHHGHRAEPSLAVQGEGKLKPLQLWGDQTSPYVKIVREALCTLQLRHEMVYVPMGSPKRKEFIEKFGHMLPGWRKSMGLIQIPLLVDPNNRTAMLESYKIVEYLNETYGPKALKRS